MLPTSIGLVPSQKIRALKTLVSIGAASRWLMTSPRSTKICSDSVTPTLCPAEASPGSSGTLQASIDFTRTVLLEGEKTTSSPTRSRPLSIRPAMIRRASNL